MIQATRYDSLDIWGATASLPEQIEDAASRVTALPGLPMKHQVENVVVMGMGGSGIAGDVLLAVAAPFMAVPVTVTKSYNIPAFVSPGTLVFAMSFSGNTEETIEAFQIAHEQGANIVVVTSGGELARLAKEAGCPIAPVPSDIPQPRAAIGAMAVPPLVILEDMGLFPGASHWIELAVEQLKRRRDQIASSGNPAEVLAEELFKKLPIITSSASLGAAAAMRWKTQINENVKAPAFFSVYPENCHNEITGWEVWPEDAKDHMAMVALRHDSEHPQVSRRFEIAREILDGKLSKYLEFRAEGEGDLAQLMDLVIVGDFVSLYLTQAEGLDPGPVPILVELKRRLKEG